MVPVPSHELDFLRHMSWSFLMFNDLKWAVAVRFVDIGGIVDRHCLNFLFITRQPFFFHYLQKYHCLEITTITPLCFYSSRTSFKTNNLPALIRILYEILSYLYNIYNLNTPVNYIFCQYLHKIRYLTNLTKFQ